MRLNVYLNRRLIWNDYITYARFSTHSLWMVANERSYSNHITRNANRLWSFCIFFFLFLYFFSVTIYTNRFVWMQNARMSMCNVHSYPMEQKADIIKNQQLKHSWRNQKNFSISIRAIDCISDFKTLEWISFAFWLFILELDYEISRFDWHNEINVSSLNASYNFPFCLFGFFLLHFFFVSSSPVHLLIHIHHHQFIE